MQRTRRYWQLVGMAIWLVGGMLGCADESALEVAAPHRGSVATQAPSPPPTVAASESPSPTPKWTLPPPTPSPTPATFRTPIPQESVLTPEPTVTPESQWEPPVDDPTSGP